MSAKTLPREMGCWIKCDGTADKGCPKNERQFTAVIVIGNNRDFAANQGWGRGLRTGYKRRDLCPSCYGQEQELFKEELAAKEERKKERDAARIAKAAGSPKKKRRSKAATSPTADHSPSAESAPAPTG